MEGVFFLGLLIIGAFLFSFFGVVVLFSRTKRLEEEIRDLREVYQYRTEDSGAEMTEAPSLAKEIPSDTAIVEMYAPPLEAAPKEIPPDAAIAGMYAPSETTPEEITAPGAFVEGQVSVVVPLSPESPGRLRAAVVAFIKGGNLWAAGGVILLAVGFGTLIAYLARRGFFTLEMGIAAAAAAGLAMILSGWRFRRKRPVYFLVLQGGGLGILYLSVFAAHKFTPYFGLPLTMVLMLLLVPPAVIMALFQKSEALAVLGFAGGFAAPLLLNDGGGNHLFLFSFYLVLNGGVLVLAFFRLWKGLNLLAFFFTFASSIFWVMTDYTRAHFFSSEPFFLIYFFLFTFLGLKSLEDSGHPSGEYRLNNFSDIILILGTPAAAAAFHWKVFSFVEHGHAFTSLAFSAFYLLLTVLVLKKFPARRAAAEGYLALGAFLANLAVPLELSPAISGAVWAAEGALLFFLGLRAHAKTWKGESAEDFRRGDPRVMAAGIAVHLASAIAFVRDMSYSPSGPVPWRSPAFSGSLVVAVSALAIAVSAEKLIPKEDGERKNYISPCAILWGLAWWFGGWLFEIRRVLPFPGNAFLVLSSVSALLSWAAVLFFGMKFFTAGMVPALLAAAFTILKVFGESGGGTVFSYNFFASSRFSGWLAFFAFQIITTPLYRKGAPEKTNAEPAWFRGTRIFTGIAAALVVSSMTGRFLTVEYGLSASWTSLAGLLPLFAVLILISVYRSSGRSPGQWSKLLFPVLPFILSGILALWFLVTLFLSGDPSPLPVYIPVLNPLDLLEGLCAACVIFWQAKERGRKNVIGKKGLIVIGDIMVFLWAAAILARSVHYYGGIPWHRITLSGGFQLCLFVFWALYGILHIVTGNRKKLRPLWIAGAVLVAADIAKLILMDMRDTSAIPRILSFFAAGLVLLFIGWAAPLPPSAREDKEN